MEYGLERVLREILNQLQANEKARRNDAKEIINEICGITMAAELCMQILLDIQALLKGR